MKFHDFLRKKANIRKGMKISIKEITKYTQICHTIRGNYKLKRIVLVS